MNGLTVVWASGMLPRSAHRIGGFAVPRNKRVGTGNSDRKPVVLGFFSRSEAKLAFGSSVSYDFFSCSSKG